MYNQTLKYNHVSTDLFIHYTLKSTLHFYQSPGMTNKYIALSVLVLAIFFILYYLPISRLRLYTCFPHCLLQPGMPHDCHLKHQCLVCTPYVYAHKHTSDFVLQKKWMKFQSVTPMLQFRLSTPFNKPSSKHTNNPCWCLN